MTMMTTTMTTTTLKASQLNSGPPLALQAGARDHQSRELGRLERDVRLILILVLVLPLTLTLALVLLLAWRELGQSLFGESGAHW